MEKASKDGIVPAGMERIQFRNGYGHVIAYTPTRITAIPFCPVKKACWVFMWKTVYPFPSVFKFNTDPQTWISEENPPMVYTRRGPGGPGFDKNMNPLMMLFGVILLLQKSMLFFFGCILLTIVFFIQLTKFNELPKSQKMWIRNLLNVVFTIAHLPFPVDPTMITAGLIMLLAGIGVSHAGVPLVISVAVIMTTFFTCAVRVGKLKARQANIK
ncbi:MAG: hypothetical protein ACXW4B_04215 [Micavibrio sp.]